MKPLPPVRLGDEYMMEKANWRDVESLMIRCVSGSGIVLSKDEERLINMARREDLERYRRLHASVKGEAIASINPLAKKV